jgi:hypothetical protein
MNLIESAIKEDEAFQAQVSPNIVAAARRNQFAACQSNDGW